MSDAPKESMRREDDRDEYPRREGVSRLVVPAGADGLLDGRVAMVTGGASGVGAAISDLFEFCGARVVILDLPEQAERFHGWNSNSRNRKLLFVGGDVRDSKACDAAIGQAREMFGDAPDIVVTAAAVERNEGHTVHSGDMTEWDRVMSVNILGVLMPVRAAVPRMIERGTGGAIITLSSTSAKVPTAGVYSVSKAAMLMLTRVLAMELAEHEIRANVIAPGYVRTPMLARVGEAKHGTSDAGFREFASEVPLGRVAAPNDIALAALFLASSWSEYMTGTTLFPDGGWANRFAGG